MVLFYKTDDYSIWLSHQSKKICAQIDSRLDKIKDSAHYGQIRRLSLLLFEIKFNNGLRIYVTEIVSHNKIIVLILRGNKNGQDKDIRKAQKIAEKIHSSKWYQSI